MIQTLKRILFWLVVCISILVCIYLNWRFVSYLSKDNIYISIKDTPISKVWLIFGTSRINNLGGLNIFFTSRIKQAIALYKAGKIEYLLISWDNSRKEYDEPTAFRDELVRRWFPAHRIMLDYGWLDTWDSITRANHIFWLSGMTLITQKMQIERALIACRYWNLTCIGSPAKDVSFTIAPRIYIREYWARLKLWFDILTPQSTIGWKKEKTIR